MLASPSLPLSIVAVATSLTCSQGGRSLGTLLPKNCCLACTGTPLSRGSAMASASKDILELGISVFGR